MKNIKWRLLSELMKNSRISDRELAKVLGVSQPTVSRTRRKLEKEGYIKEYTLIPDFTKLGYHLLVFTFVKWAREITKEEIKKARETSRKVIETQQPLEMILGERGMGLGYTSVIVSLHNDYGSYLELKNFLKQFSFIEVFETQSFIISLDDKVHYRPLTFSTLAKHLLKLKEEKSEV